MNDMVTVIKALADENRLRILMMLLDDEACVCQIIEVLGYAPSTVSKHLSTLRSAGLIESRKRGRWVYYYLPRNPSPVLKDALALVGQHLQQDPVIEADRAKGRVVCEQEPTELTKIQRLRA